MSDNNRIVNYAKWVVKRRWLVLIASAVFALFLGSGAQFITFNTDYHVFFGDDNPQLLAFDALQDKYTKDDNVLIVIQPENKNVFTREVLSAVEELADTAWLTPYSNRVDALTNFQYTHSVEDDMYVEDLARDAASKTDEELAKIKKVVMHEPLLVNRLVNEEGTVTAVNITISLPGEEMTENDEAVDFIKGMLSRWEERHAGMGIHLIGIAMMNDTFNEVAERDSMTLIPLMFLIILIMVFVTTRTFTGTITSLFLLIFSIISALGFAGWLRWELTSVTVSVPTMIMTLAIADSIHILVTMIQSMKKGMAKRDAIVESLKVNFMPVFITSVTTAIGFLSLNLSDSPPFNDLGNMTAIGVMAAFLFSITLLPAMVAIFPVYVKKAKSTEEVGSKMENLGAWVIKHNRKLLVGVTATVVILGVIMTNNTLNNDFIRFFHTDLKFRQDADFVSENLTGMYTVEYSLGAGESDGISDPEYLRTIEKFENWFYEQENVVHVNSFSEVIKRTNRAMHGDSTQFYRIPDSKQEAAQYLLLYEMSLPYGLDLNNQINVDKSETRFIVTLENVTSYELIEMNEKGEQWLKDNASEAMFAHGISTPLMFSHLGVRQATSMITGTALAIVLITLVLFFALRSFKFGLLSLIPNITPLVAGFGVWAIFDGMIHMGIVVVFGMTLGIIVDDTVHFLTKYIRGRRVNKMSAEDSIRYAFTSTGRAIIVTSIILFCGFMVLAQSKFAMNAGMGSLTAIIVALALFIDLLILPGLLIIMEGKKGKEAEANVSEGASKIETVNVN